jgi:2-polyprenyl-6-methoxyphenol hydroxylase-like FAD-dependent oxidoreductase
MNAGFPESADNHVCIVGAGPAGMVLALILARNGIPVSLLEGQPDFARAFRGDTLHCSSLEVLGQLGLAEDILKHCHARVERLEFTAAGARMTMADFSMLKTPFPFVALIPQERFLDRLAWYAQRLPAFRLLRGATATDLIREHGRIRGIRYAVNGNPAEMEAGLVVGADGRGSTIRRAAGLRLARTAPPMDVVWFTVPRLPEHAAGQSVGVRFGRGSMLAMIDRGAEWQMGYVILKGSWRPVREAGLESFRRHLSALAPDMGAAFDSLQDWSQCAILSVVTGRVERWHCPGLLLIGDAAHVMSPIGGVGINYAIQDAVAAANELIGPLRTGAVTEAHLAAVQRRRERAVRIIQSVQTLIQKRIIAAALRSERPFIPPWPLRLLARAALFRHGMAWLLARGLDAQKLREDFL